MKEVGRLDSIDQLFRLDGRVAFVTGAAGHLGSSMATILAEAGAHVILNGRSAEKIDLLAKKFEGQGLKVSQAVFDITEDKKLTAEMEKIASEFGRLDVLVNNAYSGKTGTIEKAALIDFEEAYRLTVTTAFRIMQLGRPLLEKAAGLNLGGASVINIASMYGLVSPDPSIYGDSGSNNPPFYGAAKAGLIQLTRYSACHLAPYKIRVNAISPGSFPQPEIADTNPDFYQALCQKNPMGRIGLADELKGVVLFLASDASSYVTGINLSVDGGWTAW